MAITDSQAASGGVGLPLSFSDTRGAQLYLHPRVTSRGLAAHFWAFSFSAMSSSLFCYLCSYFYPSWSTFPS